MTDLENPRRILARKWGSLLGGALLLGRLLLNVLIQKIKNIIPHYGVWLSTVNNLQNLNLDTVPLSLLAINGSLFSLSFSQIIQKNTTG